MENESLILSFLETPTCTDRRCSAENNKYMLKCSKCKLPTHFICTGLPAYQIYIFSKMKRKGIFSRKRAPKYTCAICCGDIPNYIIENNAQFMNGCRNEQLEKINEAYKEEIDCIKEACKEELKTIEINYKNELENKNESYKDELKVLEKSIVKNEEIYENILEQKQTVINQLTFSNEYLIDWLWSFCKHADEELVRKAVRDENKETQTDFIMKDYEQLRDLNEDLEKKVIENTSEIEATNNQYIKKDKENSYNMQRIATLESHQVVLRKHIADLKKMIFIKEKEKQIQATVNKELVETLSKYLTPSANQEKGGDEKTDSSEKEDKIKEELLDEHITMNGEMDEEAILCLNHQVSALKETINDLKVKLQVCNNKLHFSELELGWEASINDELLQTSLNEPLYTIANDPIYTTAANDNDVELLTPVTQEHDTADEAYSSSGEVFTSSVETIFPCLDKDKIRKIRQK